MTTMRTSVSPGDRQFHHPGNKEARRRRRLPPVLPIVIYIVDARWKHSPEVFELVQPHPPY